MSRHLRRRIRSQQSNWFAEIVQEIQRANTVRLVLRNLREKRTAPNPHHAPFYYQLCFDEGPTEIEEYTNKRHTRRGDARPFSAEQNPDTRRNPKNIRVLQIRLAIRGYTRCIHETRYLVEIRLRIQGATIEQTNRGIDVLLGGNGT